MLAYNNDPALKAALLDQIRRHREMDQIVQGTYGKGTDENWRGCAIACSLRSLDIVRGNDVAKSYEDHSRYPDELGIPLVLAYLKDRIFEDLPVANAREWPERFAAAIEPGADLSSVWPQFALWLLTDPLYGVQRYADDTGRGAIFAVAALFQRWLDGDGPAVQEWRGVADAARSAAFAAFDAFDAAAWAGANAARYAAAYSAAFDAARSAAFAAFDAAVAHYAARYAAHSDAAIAATDAAIAYIQPMADKLIELLGSAK